MNNIITIPNIEEYTQQIINGNLILTRIINWINESHLLKFNLKKSHIVECIFNNEYYDIMKYKKLLLIIYQNIDKNIIIKHSTLNISCDELYEKGFEYYDNIGLSIQGADSKRTLKEIINICKIQKYNLELKIKLQNNEIVNFKNILSPISINS